MTKNLITINATRPAAVTKKIEIDPKIQRQILEQCTDFKIGEPESYEKPATYVVAENGYFMVKKTPFGEITVEVEEIPCLGKMEEGFNLKLPKAPYSLFLQAYSFFKAISDSTGDEAALVLYWNTETEEYEYLCPEQTVSGAAVNFGKDTDYLLRMIDAKYVRVCELHSHNTMSAFHSGTDDNDEIFDCSFLVFGKLNTNKPEHIFSYAASGVRNDSVIWDLFENPVSHVNLGGVVIEQVVETPMFAVVEYPAEWHDKVTKRTYAATYGNGYAGAYGKTYVGNGAEITRLRDYYDDGYDLDYGYGTYESWRNKNLDETEKATSIDADVEKRLTDKDMLMDKDYVSELNLDNNASEMMSELEAMYGTQFMDTMCDHMVRQGYGTAWWEDPIR